MFDEEWDYSMFQINPTKYFLITRRKGSSSEWKINWHVTTITTEVTRENIIHHRPSQNHVSSDSSEL